MAAGLRREGVQARTVVLKIKHADFELRTRRATFDPPTRSSEVLYRHALELLEAVSLAKAVRLVGLGATGFTPAGVPRQQELFAAEARAQGGWETVDRTVERIRGRFGEGVICRAALKEDDEPYPLPRPLPTKGIDLGKRLKGRRGPKGEADEFRCRPCLRFVPWL